MRHAVRRHRPEARNLGQDGSEHRKPWEVGKGRQAFGTHDVVNLGLHAQPPLRVPRHAQQQGQHVGGGGAKRRVGDADEVHGLVLRDAHALAANRRPLHVLEAEARPRRRVPALVEVRLGALPHPVVEGLVPPRHALQPPLPRGHKVGQVAHPRQHVHQERARCEDRLEGVADLYHLLLGTGAVGHGLSKEDYGKKEEKRSPLIRLVLRDGAPGEQLREEPAPHAQGLAGGHHQHVLILGQYRARLGLRAAAVDAAAGLEEVVHDGLGAQQDVLLAHEFYPHDGAMLFNVLSVLEPGVLLGYVEEVSDERQPCMRRLWAEFAFTACLPIGPGTGFVPGGAVFECHRTGRRSSAARSAAPRIFGVSSSEASRSPNKNDGPLNVMLDMIGRIVLNLDLDIYEKESRRHGTQDRLGP
ncbi:hypothetical protein PoMZ_03000 [Pyricularia oryzae]|uniref:Uncharacterized protein n=1 Tax=Pyricularia oryzae TaxID=318829 RepID=A0A4P7N9R4_PYROR|nr:hypothetical protein PoMZ_03000 [Pyricularia oryzae]